MDVGFFLRECVLGFSIAAPVGPIGVLCIRRSLAESSRAGFVSGLGAATADAIYGSIAAFGLTVISNILIGQQSWLRLIGGAFLCYLGVKTFLATPAGQSAPADEHRLLGAYGSTFLLTLTNPLTILSFAAVFAGVGISSGGGKLRFGGTDGPGRLHRVRALVAHPERGRWPPAHTLRPAPPPVNQPGLGHGHCRLRPRRLPEPESMRVARHRAAGDKPRPYM